MAAMVCGDGREQFFLEAEKQAERDNGWLEDAYQTGSPTQMYSAILQTGYDAATTKFAAGDLVEDSKLTELRKRRGQALLDRSRFKASLDRDKRLSEFFCDALGMSLMRGESRRGCSLCLGKSSESPRSFSLTSRACTNSRCDKLGGDETWLQHGKLRGGLLTLSVLLFVSGGARLSWGDLLCRHGRTVCQKGIQMVDCLPLNALLTSSITLSRSVSRNTLRASEFLINKRYSVFLLGGKKGRERGGVCVWR